jgi:hypothetical protein
MINILFGCTNKAELNKIFTQDERIDILIYQEEVENGAVIFYVPKLNGSETAKANFEARFIQKTLLGWKGTFDRGQLSGTLEGNLYSLYLQKGSSKSPFPLLFGEITNPGIEKVMIKIGEEPDFVETKRRNYIYY